MECLVCSTWMRRIVEPNGKVYWHCLVCQYTEPTGELAPDPTDEWEEDEDNNQD